MDDQSELLPLLTASLRSSPADDPDCVDAAAESLPGPVAPEKEKNHEYEHHVRFHPHWKQHATKWRTSPIVHMTLHCVLLVYVKGTELNCCYNKDMHVACCFASRVASGVDGPLLRLAALLNCRFE